MSDQVVAPNPAGVNSSRQPYWCHQCQQEIEPLMAPMPTCPRCNSEFVEKIEDGNDPRAFVDQGPLDRDTDEELDEFNQTIAGTNAGQSDVVQAVQNWFQSFLGQNTPLRVETRTYGNNDSGTTRTTTTTITTSEGTTTTTTDQPQGGDQNRSDLFFTMGASAGDNEDGRLPLLNLAHLLQRALSEGTTQGGVSNLPWMNFLNMVGDPRDYAWGAGGLDNIISQLMEQQAGQAPPPASDETINNLPKTIITKKQVSEEQLGCPVCKDDFKEGEEATCLPCNHTFHDDCIRPWLKMNGTCPVCRLSLVSQEGRGDGQNQSGGSGNGPSNQNNTNAPFNGNGLNGNFNLGNLNGDFNGNTQNSSSQSGSGWSFPGSYPTSQQRSARQDRRQGDRDQFDIEPLD